MSPVALSFLEPCGWLDLQDELCAAKLYTETVNNKTGQKEKHFRKQVSLNSRSKPHIHYIRYKRAFHLHGMSPPGNCSCYVTVKTCLAHPDFSFDVLAASVFKIDREDVEMAAKGGLLIKRVFDSVEPVLSKRLNLQVNQFIEQGDSLTLEAEKCAREENECPKEANMDQPTTTSSSRFFKG